MGKQKGCSFAKKILPPERIYTEGAFHGASLYLYLSSSVISRRTRQGLPTATTPEGISRVTTLPAPITVLSPIVTPGSTVTPAPIQTLLPTVIGRAISRPALRCSTSSGCPAAEKQQFGAMNT